MCHWLTNWIDAVFGKDAELVDRDEGCDETATMSGDWTQLYHDVIDGAVEIEIPDWTPHAEGLNWDYHNVRMYVENRDEQLVTLQTSAGIMAIDVGVKRQLSLVLLSEDGTLRIQTAGRLFVDLWLVG